MLRKTFVAFCFLPFSSAFAGVDLHQLTYAGTGCSADGPGIRAKLSSVSSRLVVYMPDMKSDGSNMSRKVCSLALPISVAPNERLVVGRPSIFGKESLSSGQKMEAFSEAFFAGTTGPVVRQEIEGHGRRLRDFYRIEQDSISLPCGQDAIVRTRTVLMASGEAEVRGIALDVKVLPCGR